MRATVVRHEQGQLETLGVLLLDGRLQCYTLEPPWLHNSQWVSCIPPGAYRCERIETVGHGTLYRVLDVPGRENILLGHAGNTYRDTSGCILLGREPGYLLNPGARAILHSRDACRQFLHETRRHDVLNLHIIGVST